MTKQEAGLKPAKVFVGPTSPKPGPMLKMQATLEIWLYVHVPLTVALLAALLVHIVTVFLYW